MQDLYGLLYERLKGVRKLAVLGAGSVLRADDAIGMLIIDKLQAALEPGQHPNVALYPGETAPENFCGKLLEFCPTHLLMLDAANLGQAPGSITEIDINDVGGPTFCSHMLPLKVMVDYLKGEIGLNVTLLGIQYKCIDFDCAISYEAEHAVEEISTAVISIINELLN